MEINIPQGKIMPSVNSLDPGTTVEGAYIKMLADPEFVLYYESFPIGDDISWTLYTDLPYTVYASLNDSRQTIQNFNELEADFVSNVKKEVSDYLLTKGVDDDYLKDVENMNVFLTNKLVGGELGSWHHTSVADIFNISFTGFNLAKASSIKYLACGDNALCLKTHKNIYRFPLTNCDDIDSIELHTDSFWSFGHQRGFGLASPCKLKVKIYRASGNNCYCHQKLSTPIFNVSENGTATTIGKRTMCFNELGEEKADNNFQCIIVEAVGGAKDGTFCYVKDRSWTYNNIAEDLELVKSSNNIYPVLKPPRHWRGKLGLKNIFWRWPD